MDPGFFYYFERNDVILDDVASDHLEGVDNGRQYYGKKR